jgi:hypothetical protein
MSLLAAVGLIGVPRSRIKVRAAFGDATRMKIGVCDSPA